MAKQIEETMAYCTTCEETTPCYVLPSTSLAHIKGESFYFNAQKGYCRYCDSYVDIPYIDEINKIEIDRQYRKRKKLINIEKIHRLIRRYGSVETFAEKVGISVEEAIACRDGKFPSKETSDKIRLATKSKERHVYGE